MFFLSYLPYWLIIIASIVVSFVLYKFGRAFLSRKILHIVSISACAMATQATMADSYWSFVIQILAATVVLWVAVINGVFKTDNRKSWGIAYFPTVLTALVLLFPNKLHEIGLSFLVLAWADGLSAILGRVSERILPEWNKVKWGFDTKTALGSIVFGITTFVCLCSSEVLNFNNAGMGFKITFLSFLSISTALVEIISSKGRDNIWIPLWVFFSIPLLENWSQIYELGVWAVVLVVVFGLVTTKMKWLHLSGALFALILGGLIYIQGLPILPVLVFFVLGSLVSKLTKNNQSDEKQSKPRDAFQVVANGGWVGGLALLSGLYPDKQAIFINLVYVSMAVALSDTLSSELGMFFRGKTVSITTLKPLPTGVSGGVSLYGSLAGLIGAAIIGGVAIWANSGTDLVYVEFLLWGFGGMLLDSVLGDVFQARFKRNDQISDTGEIRIAGFFRLLNNDQVNLLSNGIVILACFLCRF